jgi:hypothetical protein
MNRLVVLLAMVAAVSWAGAAQAQCCGVPVVAYYAPVPTTVYYATPTCCAPRTVYYAPQTVYYPPEVGPIVTTRYRPILGGTVTRVYYPAARPWLTGYWPYY